MPMFVVPDDGGARNDGCGWYVHQRSDKSADKICSNFFNIFPERCALILWVEDWWMWWNSTYMYSPCYFSLSFSLGAGSDAASVTPWRSRHHFFHTKTRLPKVWHTDSLVISRFCERCSQHHMMMLAASFLFIQKLAFRKVSHTDSHVTSRSKYQLQYHMRVMKNSLFISLPLIHFLCRNSTCWKNLLGLLPIPKFVTISR